MDMKWGVLCKSEAEGGGRSVFFFQAEDGIRDRLVTGVQTCALPILVDEVEGVLTLHAKRAQVGGTVHGGQDADHPVVLRSEERRVGKECRSRWSPYH